ncbi:trypsin-like serine protease [Hyalangium minutum]|uniref:Peptidase S1 domain-containing protein n=1 Tax=Hyalangium minutum TaxID=394096 RepID=A0A085WLG7_9BACT|nr:trypsin-like serine protease [Hyalangium minutum]KFE68530.1 hypothetical protein DB31_7767 [Hyalangium minutum]
MSATVSYRSLTVLIRWLGRVALLLGCACGASAPAERQTAAAYVPAEIQPEMGESIISKGSLDTSNRYKATVLVDGGRGPCSGVLVAPRVVVTAGHCVCSPHKATPADAPARALIDKTTCARTATIAVITYRPKEKPIGHVLSGAIRPNEKLRILYDDDGKELASQADLAVIALDKAPQGVTPIRMARAEVRYAEAVTLVGFGATEFAEQQRDQRRYGFNEVATLAEDGATFIVGKSIEVRRPYKPKERLLVRQEASYSLSGDSGGPCLRESDGAMELVGIAKTHYGGGDLVQFSEYTSTLFYRAWLLQAIADVERRETD